MESKKQSLENDEKFGRNVTLVIDLIRHPEKDYATGNLTDAGKAAFVEKLKKEYVDSGFDIVKGYVSPLKRGQQAMEPMKKFLEETGIATTIRTKKELEGRMKEYTKETDQAMDRISEERNLLNVGELHKDDAFEPISKDEESLKNEILIQEFFDKEFPEGELKGEDIAAESDNLVRHFAKMAERFYSGSKVKIVSAGHGGVIEYLTKLVYLKNHPELKSEDVGVEQIGGLLGYMEGPKITIVSDEQGKQTAKLKFKDLVLDYPIDD